jgi:mono/diheme cytochrome c family protein
MEHALAMFLALSMLHMGRVRSRRAATPNKRQRWVAISTWLALSFVAVAIPWPGTKHGRPLFRLPSASEPARAAAEGVCPPLYVERCAVCHGPSGAGDGMAAASLEPKPRKFSEPGWGEMRSDAQLLAVIRAGGSASGLSAAMPAQPDLSEAQLNALLICVRALQRSTP